MLSGGCTVGTRSEASTDMRARKAAKYIGAYDDYLYVLFWWFLKGVCKGSIVRFYRIGAYNDYLYYFGASVTYTIVGVAYDNYSIMGPQTLF